MLLLNNIELNPVLHLLPYIIFLISTYSERLRCVFSDGDCVILIGWLFDIFEWYLFTMQFFARTAISHPLSVPEIQSSIRYSTILWHSWIQKPSTRFCTTLMKWSTSSFLTICAFLWTENHPFLLYSPSCWCLCFRDLVFIPWPTFTWRRGFCFIQIWDSCFNWSHCSL